MLLQPAPRVECLYDARAHPTADGPASSEEGRHKMPNRRFGRVAVDASVESRNTGTAASRTEGIAPYPPPGPVTNAPNDPGWS